MKRSFSGTEVEVVEGDITTIAVDAIVNAANSRLVVGGGVDGAIHRAGGSAIFEDSRRHGGCPTGQAVVTVAGRLPAKHVIHTVGPVYGGGSSEQAQLLASCYRNSLAAALEHGCQSVSFPSISTGVFGYPFEEACNIALASIHDFVSNNYGIQRVLLVAYGTKDASAYGVLLEGFRPD